MAEMNIGPQSPYFFMEKVPRALVDTPGFGVRKQPFQVIQGQDLEKWKDHEKEH